jgi:methyl-accepting chemotaxis protein PixJ
MTNPFNLAFPVVKQHLSHNGEAPLQRAHALALALGLSIIPALSFGATSYYLTSKASTTPIARTQSGGSSISPVLQKQLLLKLALFNGVTALLVSAIALFAYRLSASKKAQLFADITSQNQSLDLDYLYKRVVEGAREILQSDRVVIYSFDSEWNGTITVEAVAPGVTQLINTQIVDTCIKDSQGGLYKNGRVCVINDITQAGLSECHIKLLEKYQVKANMVVPILKDAQLLGLLIAHQCDQPRVWQQNDIDFFMHLAVLIALRLGHLNFQRAKTGQARSFSNVALRIHQSLNPEDIFSTAAREIRQVLNVDLDPEAVFNTAVKEIRQTLNVDRVVICRLSASLQDGTLIAESVVSGWPKMLGLQLGHIGIKEDYLEMFKNGYVHAISNTLQESALNHTDTSVTEQYNIKASLVAPIRTSNQLVGLMIAHQCSVARTWEQSTINVFEVLATEVGLAIEQATLLKSAATEAKGTKLLAEFTAHICQSLNSQDIFSTSVEDIRKTIETDRVLIYRFHPDGTSGEITSQAIAPAWKPVEGQILNELFKEENFQGYRTGSLWVGYDVYKTDPTSSHLKLLEDFQIKASMVAPIVVDDQLVGLLCVHQCSSHRDWQQSEFYLLKQLAAQIGFALDQAKLIEQVNMVYRVQQQQTEELRRQLVSLIEDVKGVAKGDLTIRAEVREGEIGSIADFFNAVIESLRGIVKQVKLATTQVNASLGENEGASRQLADLAFKQAEETTRTLDSVEQMTHSIQQVAQGAHQAADVVRTASATAQAGEEAMDHTVQTILNLRKTVAETANKVKHLGESSQQISKVVALINQIALQTNLLAINAGIEARRTDKENQGFVVVAKEIGELAARSAAATKEIEQIVETIQFETTQVVEAIELGTIQVVESTHLVEDTKQSLSRILEVSHQIGQLVASISVAAVSQTQTSKAVTDLMQEMAKVSQEASKSSYQISGSLQQTMAVAQQLQASVEVFKVDEATNQTRSL